MSEYYTPERLAAFSLEALRGLRKSAIESDAPGSTRAALRLTEEINHRTIHTQANVIGTKIGCNGDMCREVLNKITKYNEGHKIQGV